MAKNLAITPRSSNFALSNEPKTAVNDTLFIIEINLKHLWI